ncbi:MAG: flavin-dependent dehydrogenase [Cyanothece sp. SIO1E1]|nr:flavin-dependent dehydrogenase [Cyanothece sp. SIO1E1]
MKQLLYLEIPTPNITAVRTWLHKWSAEQWAIPTTPTPTLIPTTEGVSVQWSNTTLVLFTWQVQNTTYLKAFQWSEQSLPHQQYLLNQLTQALRAEFPYRAPQLPEIDLRQSNIFSALEPYYPLTVKYFQRMPNGEFDLQRAYWWEKRWREGVKSGFTQPPAEQAMCPPILRQSPDIQRPDSKWDIVVVGGALGVINAAMMAQLGYKVALVERIKFGRMNREWNISRSELQTLVDAGLFTRTELESLIAREYQDNFNLFFSGNNPPNARAAVLSTPTVLNIAMDCDRLLQVCGQKLLAAGGQIFERTEFEQAFLEDAHITIRTRNLETDQVMHLQSRLLIDAMGTASPIAQQINHGRAFDCVCPTIGGVIKGGFAPGVWDSNYGEPLLTIGDISRGRQLIWEMFPGAEGDLTIYLFHYHQVSPDDPGALLELYEDFFTCLPEYRRCNVDDLEWRKATFGYIPGRFSRNASDRLPGHDRVLSIGDAASLNSPLIFTGFGSLVRNLPRITHLLHTALKFDLLTGKDLGKINAYQDNLAVTWIFSRGMMARPHAHLEPQWINAILNSFFGILTTESADGVDDFIKDRSGWMFINRTTLKAGWQNPQIPLWMIQAIGLKGLLSWVPTYLAFTFAALMAFLCKGWVPRLLQHWQGTIASHWPRLWHSLLAWSYRLTYGMGNPQSPFRLPPVSAPIGAEATATSSRADSSRSKQIKRGKEGLAS